MCSDQRQTDREEGGREGWRRKRREHTTFLFAFRLWECHRIVYDNETKRVKAGGGARMRPVGRLQKHLNGLKETQQTVSHSPQ